MSESDVYEVRFDAPDRESLAKAIRELGLDLDHQHPEPRKRGKELRVGGFLTERQIDEIKARGWAIEVGDNLSERGRARQQEVGRGDRFEGGKKPPTGLGKKVR